MERRKRRKIKVNQLGSKVFTYNKDFTKSFRYFTLEKTYNGQKSFDPDIFRIIEWSTKDKRKILDLIESGRAYIQNYVDKEFGMLIKLPEMRCCQSQDCGKRYDVDELVRITGKVPWRDRYCSASCYTKEIRDEVSVEGKSNKINITDLKELTKRIEFHKKAISDHRNKLVGIAEDLEQLIYSVEEGIEGIEVGLNDIKRAIDTVSEVV